jgi:hypothetical protein
MTLGGVFRSRRAVVLSCAAALAACGGGKAEPTEPVDTGDAVATGAPDPAPDAAPTSEPAASATPVEPGPASSERSPMEALARDMIKTGRKIGWSPTKRTIAYGEYWTEPGGRGFHVMFVAEDGKSEQHEVCKAGECDEVLDERVKTEVPKIAAKLESGAYQALSSSGWAVDQPELELRGSDIKLTFKGGKLSVAQGGKTKPLGSAPPKSAPVAVFLAKDDKVVVVDFRLDAPGKSDQGFAVANVLRLYKLP